MTTDHDGPRAADRLPQPAPCNDPHCSGCRDAEDELYDDAAPATSGLKMSELFPCDPDCPTCVKRRQALGPAIALGLALVEDDRSSGDGLNEADVIMGEELIKASMGSALRKYVEKDLPADAPGYVVDERRPHS